MKISIFILLLAFATLCPLKTTAYIQTGVTLSAFVAANIFSYVEGDHLIVQKNFQSPLSISLSGSDKNDLQYIETQQKIRIPMEPGTTITLTESL